MAATMLLALLLLPSAPAAPVHSSPGGLTAVSSTLANSKQPALPSQAEGGNVTLRSIYTDHMVLQHGVAARIVGEASGAAAGVAVSVLLDGKSGSSSGSATTAGGAFQVEIKPQPASTDSHTVTITVAGFAPVTLSDILFGDVYLCSGCVAPPLQACPSIQRLTDCGPCRQSNMGLSVQQSNNATAEIAAANYPRIRITQVAGSWSSTSPQANARFTIPWDAITPKNIAGFSGLCYYFGRAMHDELGGKTPIGLVEQAVGGTYIESFMPAETMKVCNTTGVMPPGWKGAPPQPGKSTSYNPWGAQNVPAALWNSMISPLLTLDIKLAIFDQAEHNMATRESGKFRCLQDQMVGAWRTAWGSNFTYHSVQLPSINMSEYTWIYIDSLGEMRLSQSGTDADIPGATTTVTLDLADLKSPFGSVHNRQKQEVGRRVALNALATAYHHTDVNAGPHFKTVEVVGGATVVHISSSVASKGGGAFNSSNDCIECCKQSAFETSADGTTWARATPTGKPLAMGGDTVEVSFPPSLFHPPKFLRYGYDALVQCPYFDADGLPLGPFQIAL